MRLATLATAAALLLSSPRRARLGRVGALAALMLFSAAAGCVEGPFGGANRDQAEGILPSEAREKADAAAFAWKEDAVLVTLKGDAHGTQEPGLFTFGNPGGDIFLDGRAGGWQFSYSVPGTVALMLATVDADGAVDTRQLDLTSFTPDTAGYEEYFEMTPIDPAWLDMAKLVSVVRENETTRPLTEGKVTSVAYSLKPDVRASYSWTVDVAREDATASFAIDPETWTFLSGEVAFRAGPATSFEQDSDAGKPPSGLAVRTAYGTRDPGGDLSALRFDLSYSKASRPFTLDQFTVRLDTGDGVRTYTNTGDAPFEAAGAGPNGTIAPGARFTVTLPLAEGDHIGTRTTIKVSFHTPKGAALRFEGSTPITFGRSTAVPLE